MASVLEKQLARALDMRLAVFASKAASGSLLQDEMSLRAAAYMASEIIMPCCCIMCKSIAVTDEALCGKPGINAASGGACL